MDVKHRARCHRRDGRFSASPRALPWPARSRRHRGQAAIPARWTRRDGGRSARSDMKAFFTRHDINRVTVSRSDAGPTSDKGAIIDGLRQVGNLPRRLYRELAAAQAGDRLLELYDEEDTARPATTADASDERLAECLTGLATALAIGASFSAENLPAGDESPEEQLGAAEFRAHVRSVVAGRPSASERSSSATTSQVRRSTMPRRRSGCPSPGEPAPRACHRSHRQGSSANRGCVIRMALKTERGKTSC